VWNRTANNKDATTRIRDVLKETLDIPVNGAFDYKAHTVSLHHVGAAGGAEGGATGHHHHHHQQHHLQRHGSGEGHSGGGGERGVMQRRFSNDAHDGE
jgi:hypothetical protein